MKSDDWESVSYSHLCLMRFYALIPFKGQTLDYMLTKLLSVYAVAANVLYHSPYTYYAIVKFSQKVFEAEYICEVVVVQGVFFRYFTLYMNRDKLTRLLDSCRGLWCHLADDSEIETVNSFAKRADQFRNFILTNTLVISTTFYATFFILTASIPKDQKPLVFKFYVEVHTEPWYTTVMIMQFVVVYTIAVQMATMEGIGLYFVMMACGYLRVVRNRLVIFSEKKKQETDEEAIHREIVDCVKFHQKIMFQSSDLAIRYCQEIETLMSKIYMITVITTVYNISIIGIKLLENGDDKFIYVTIMTNNIFTFFTAQWAPEHLLAESEAIGGAAYFASHRQQPKLPTKTSKTLLMMILRSQRPMQITAGGIINLSIETFGTMIKNAFSFFAVLRSFAE